MSQLYNKTETKQTRRALRKNIPQPEILIWRHLRNRQLNNVKFRRQYSIGRYVLDFYSPERRLAIEIDGDSHFTKSGIENDQVRSNVIQNLGIRLIRFTNKEVWKILME